MIRVTGGLAAKRAAARLESAARGGLKRDLERAVKRGTRNVEKYFRANSLERMPKRGGFAADLAKAKVKTSRIDFGVHLEVVSPHDMRRIEQGRLRHPVYGDTDTWVSQRVPADVVRDAVVRADAEIKREVDAAFRRATGGGT